MQFNPLRRHVHRALTFANAALAELRAMKLLVRPESPPGPAAKDTPPLLLSPVEQQILDALGDGPMIGRRIAAGLGTRYDARLRTLLRNLVERGILQSGAGGYRRRPTSDTIPP